MNGMSIETKSLEKLDSMILKYYEENRLPTQEYINIMAFVTDLEQKIQTTLPGAQLKVGGSINNGFGTRDSDVDLILLSADSTQDESRDEIETLTLLSQCLTEMKIPNKVVNAKVNIAKCYSNNYIHRPIDVCYNNRLALKNVELLRKYCEWEPNRLPALGMWLKKWTKICHLGKAVQGGFSSYAWNVMSINYLQNCEPPVLPRLQEDFRASDTNEENLNSHDVYFHKNVEPNWSKNIKSVGELFLGFLDYIRNFNFQDEVIQIRRKKPVTKQEKSWTAIFCVEDPFLLSYNISERRAKSSNKIWGKFQSAADVIKFSTSFSIDEMQEAYAQKDLLIPINYKLCPLCKGVQDCQKSCTLRPIRHPGLYKKDEKLLLKQEWKEKRCAEKTIKITNSEQEQTTMPALVQWDESIFLE